VGKRQCYPGGSAGPPCSLHAPDPNDRHVVTHDFIIADLAIDRRTRVMVSLASIVMRGRGLFSRKSFDAASA
jgi:hypothetical protein